MSLGNTQVPLSITIVDDDPQYRESLAEELTDHAFKANVIEGRYGKDLNRLVNDIIEFDSGFVICDHRLQGRNFASFNGAKVIRELSAAQKPAMLLTMYQDTNRLELRKNRVNLPVVVGRNEFDVNKIGAYAEICRREIAQDPIDERRAHRTLIRLEEVKKTQAGIDLFVVIPAWRPEECIVLPTDCVSTSLLPSLKSGAYLLADVNIGAPSQDELFFKRVDELVEPKEG